MKKNLYIANLLVAGLMTFTVDTAKNSPINCLFKHS